MKLTKTTFAVALALCFAAACAHAPDAAAPGATEEDDPLLETYRAAYLSNDPALYREARDRHAEYAQKNPDARELRLRYAKLLYALGENEAAAEQFARVSAGGSDHLGKSAARNLIVVWHEARAGKSTELKLLRDRGRLDRATLNFEIGATELPDYSAGAVQQRPIPAGEKSLADACDKYFELADDQDTALPTFRLMSAEIYFRHGHAIEGSDRCDAIVARWPQTELAESCVHATVDALNQRRAWKELERHARSFRNNLSLIGADHLLEQQLEQVVQVATFNRIQSAAESQAPRDPAVERRALIKGAEEMRAFQREFPYAESADEALYNAFVYYARAEKKNEAIAAAQALLAVYSSSPLVREVQVSLKKLNLVLTAEARRL